MRNSLWIIIAIVSTILGFVMGYATAPMMETGMLSGKGAKPASRIESTKELEQHYRDLFKEK